MLFITPLIFLFFNGQFYNPLEGDEPRYLAYANNLMSGFFADPQQPYLTNGPGYPVILAILLKFNFPIVAIKKVNLLFLYASVSIFFMASSILTQHKKTSLFLALLFEYYILSSNREYFKLLTEPLAVLLVCSITYLVLLKENRLGLITGVLLGFLVLVKVVFAYVVLALLFILVFFKYNSNKKEMVDGHVKMLLVAFLVNVPYLFYTYSLTGNFLSWANNGGKSIYWMASPYKYELGDCVSPNLKVVNNHEIVDFDSNYIYKKHSTEYHSILALPIGIQDIEFKKKRLISFYVILQSLLPIGFAAFLDYYLIDPTHFQFNVIEVTHFSLLKFQVHCF